MPPPLFNLDPHSSEPLYRQLIAQVRRLVAAGQLVAGTEMPSVRELAMSFAINPMTVSRAYSLLESEGVLGRQRGARMVVAEQASDRLDRRSRLALLRPALRQLLQQARELDVSVADVVSELHELNRTREPEQ